MEPPTAISERKGIGGEGGTLRLFISAPISRAFSRAWSASPLLSPADSERTGLVIDLETTGLDHYKDEVIEIAMVKFRFDQDGAITGITDTFQAFHQPSILIPPAITKLTGITDSMVAGQAINTGQVDTFVAGANIVIAHNAAFDRKFAERIAPIFEHKPWTCSATEIAWKDRGFSGPKLAYLLAEAGFFYHAHRAIDDCHAVIELLARQLPGTSATALSALLGRARRNTCRIWAEHSPYDLKDHLKLRGYRWNDGADGSLRCWYVDVDAERPNSISCTGRSTSGTYPFAASNSRRLTGSRSAWVPAEPGRRCWSSAGSVDDRTHHLVETVPERAPRHGSLGRRLVGLVRARPAPEECPVGLLGVTRRCREEHLAALYRGRCQSVLAPGSPRRGRPARFSAGHITKEQAVRDLGLRDYSELLPALGDAGLPLPMLPENELRSMTANFLRVWKPERKDDR